MTKGYIAFYEVLPSQCSCDINTRTHTWLDLSLTLPLRNKVSCYSQW